MIKPQAVGIDLGTTYSAVARIDDTGRSAMVRNSQGDLLTPSVVLFEDREIIVGKEAKKAVGILTDRVAECVKRDMGSPVYSKPIRGERLPPEVIQSCILRKLKNDVVAALGPDIKVVITVPAYFDEARRKATADAGEMAGLEVLDIVNEPTAAALAFGEHLGYLDPSGAPLQQMKVVVYDLGGGTFDVTVIDLTPGNIRTLATDGDVRLGGRDWDEHLADYLATEFQKLHGIDLRQDPSGLARLLFLAEEAKHTLSARPQALVHIEHGGHSQDLTIPREKFDELTAALLERTSHTTRQVLAGANLQWRDISHVLLVGGSTRMPMVRAMLEKLTGLAPDPTVHPDEAVARGAAVYAGYLLASRDAQNPAGPKFKVIDVNAHALGIEGIDQRTQRKENVVLIKRNTALPYRVTEKFVTKSAGQQSIVVQVLEGDSKLPEECSPIGRAVMRHLPPELPKNWPVEVTYEYGANGRLNVRAKVPGTSNDLTIELEREKGLSDDRVARWKQILTEDQGFDAFENMLDQVLKAGGLEPPTLNSAAPRPVGPKPAMPTAPPVPVKPTAPVKPTVPVSSQPIPLSPKPADAKTLSPGPVFPQPIERPGSPAPPAVPTARPPMPQRPSPAPPGLGALDIDTGGGFAVSGGRSSRHSTLRTVVNISGHIIASTAGLVLGYYILCYIAPQANFLNLTLPGLPPAAAPNQPGQPSVPR